MGWLVFVVFVIAILSLNDLANENHRKISLFISWFLMSITAGLRNVGGLYTDYAAYKAHYNGDFGGFFIDSFEKGYCIAVWLGNFIGLSFNMFLFILTSVTLFFLIRIIAKYSQAPMLSILLYVGTYFLYYNMVLTRQMVAVVAFIYCIRYIITKEDWKFFVVLLIGFSFHNSIVILLPAYPILRFLKLNKYTVLLIVSFTLCFYVVGIENLLVSLFSLGVNDMTGKMVGYVVKASNFHLNIMEYVKMGVMITGIIILYSMLKDSFENEVFIKSYLIFCGFIFVFGHVEILFRMAMYFDLTILFLIPIMLNKISFTFHSKIIIYVALALFSFASFVYRANNFDNGEFYQYKFYFLEK